MPRLLNKRLTGRQHAALEKALIDAFDPQRLEKMLLQNLNRRLYLITLGGNFEKVVFDVIERAEMESWTAELLLGARTFDPNNLDLFAFAQQFGLTSTPPDGKANDLERTIRKANPMLDPTPWGKKLGLLENQICCIEIQGKPAGTGFLLGPSVVMTNYHVVERVIEGGVAPKQVKLRFDFRATSDNMPINPGQTYNLAEVLDSSKYSPVDTQPDTGAVPEPNQLDYALLKVDGAPGDDPASMKDMSEPAGPPRGWIKFSETDYDFESAPALFILQHPEGRPLKLALDTESVFKVNSNQTRVRYHTNTEPGSSGSPCFNANWELVALHHSGDPNYKDLKKAEYNQGIPFAAITALMDERGTKQWLGQ
jgi:hypothetical protein